MQILSIIAVVILLGLYWYESYQRYKLLVILRELQCDNTADRLVNKHSWRGSQFDTHHDPKNDWCCQCARDAKDIVDSVLSKLELREIR